MERIPGIAFKANAVYKIEIRIFDCLNNIMTGINGKADVVCPSQRRLIFYEVDAKDIQ
jgi:hypothetical protein